MDSIADTTCGLWRAALRTALHCAQYCTLCCIVRVFAALYFTAHIAYAHVQTNSEAWRSEACRAGPGVEPAPTYPTSAPGHGPRGGTWHPGCTCPPYLEPSQALGVSTPSLPCCCVCVC